MNEQVQEKARELARIISVSKEYVTMRMAEDAASQDPALTALSARYYEKRQEMEELTTADSPDFERMGVLSNEMSAIQEEMKQLPLAAAMRKAHQEFTDMMNMVNHELSSVLDPEHSDCTGNCSSCGGCH